MKKCLFVISTILLFFIFFNTANARSGCCSWHGGVCGCGCCDGTSLSSTCAPYYPECSSYSSPTYSSPIYNTPTYTPSIPDCPMMSSYNSFSGHCECFSGYVVDTNILGNETCISANSKCINLLGYGSQYSSLTKKCECRYGYILNGSKCESTTTYCNRILGIMSSYNSLTQQCECMIGYKFNGSICKYDSSRYDYTPINTNNTQNICPTNSSLDSENKCHCYDGYVVNASKDACIQLLCPTNSYVKEHQCICTDGYFMINNTCKSYTESCQNTYGENSYGDKDYCYCNSGYKWNDSKTLCIKNEIICPINSENISGACSCLSGYKFDTNKTTCLKISFASTNSVINIRQKPIANGKIIGKTKKNISYEIIDDTNKEWINIKINEKTNGFIFRKLSKIK